MNNRHSYPLSTASSHAADSYRDGVDAMLAVRTDAAHAAFTAAVRADAACALAQIGLALCEQSRGHGERASHHRDAARAHVAGATPREVSHVDVMIRIAERPDRSTVEAMRQHLARYPDDGLVLEQVLRYVFFFGGRGRKQTALDILAAVAPADHDDWYLLSRQAFYLQEAHHYRAAEPLARRALQLAPHNANAAHALAHILHGTGRHEEAAQFLRAWVTDYDGMFRSHLHWHIALASLVRDDRASAWQLYHAHLAPERNTGPVHLAMADVVGFLSSAALCEPRRALPWHHATELARALEPRLGTCFIAVYAAVAFGFSGDTGAATRLLASLRERAEAGDEQATAISVPIAQALRGFARGEFASAADILGQFTEDDLEAMGGSNVERGLVFELLAYALRQVGRFRDIDAVVTPLLARWPPAHPALDRALRAARS